MNNKQVITVIALLAVSIAVAVYNRTTATEAESVPVIETSYTEKAPDFENMKILNEYKVTGTDITIRVVDNETLTSFGPGRVTIYKNDEKVCGKQIANDGGTLYDFNVDIKSDSENVYVTLKGCEQEDETVTVPIK